MESADGLGLSSSRKAMEALWRGEGEDCVLCQWYQGTKCLVTWGQETLSNNVSVRTAAITTYSCLLMRHDCLGAKLEKTYRNGPMTHKLSLFVQCLKDLALLGSRTSTKMKLVIIVEMLFHMLTQTPPISRSRSPRNGDRLPIERVDSVS